MTPKMIFCLTLSMLKLETEVIQVSAEGSVKHLLLPSIDIEEQERTICDK